MDQQEHTVTETKPPFPSTQRPAHQGRLLIPVGLILFGVSTLFPVLASLTTPELLPGWIGWLDVTLAFLTVGLMLVIDTRARGKSDDHVKLVSYRLYRVLAYLPLILLVVFFIFGNRIRWDILLPGLAWRAWLLAYSLPAVVTVWRMSHIPDKGS